MGKAKDILLKPIDAKTANELIKRVHYSGKVVQNSQIHIGVFYLGNLEGAFQFGPSIDKHRLIGLVSGTQWHEFIELNRLAFTDVLPRNSESRAIAVCMRVLRKHAPQVKWVISYADGTQCGDGTIYRASGFALTDIKKNTDLIRLPDGRVVHKLSVHSIHFPGQRGIFQREAPKFLQITKGSYSTQKYYDAVGIDYEVIKGFQLRYIYFLDPSYRERLTVPELPYSEIERRGAGMYKGIKRGRGETDNAPQTNEETGGASPTRPLLVDITGGSPELVK